MYDNTTPPPDNGDNGNNYDTDDIDIRPFLWEPDVPDRPIAPIEEPPALLNPITAQFSRDDTGDAEGETKSVVAHAFPTASTS